MGLTIELKPYERLIVGRTVITNGPRRAKFLVETQEKILRGSHILGESEADTPCKRLYLVLEQIYLADPDPALEERYVALSTQIQAAAPSLGRTLALVSERVLTGDHYGALKRAKDLVRQEAALLAAAMPAAD